MVPNVRRDIVPLGSTKSNFNYNLDEKRVLNMENVVDDADNIKQVIRRCAHRTRIGPSCCDVSGCVGGKF